MKTYHRVMYAGYYGGELIYRACLTTNGKTVRFYTTDTLDSLLIIAHDKKCKRFIFEFIDDRGYLTNRYDIPLV